MPIQARMLSCTAAGRHPPPTVRVGLSPLIAVVAMRGGGLGGRANPLAKGVRICLAEFPEKIWIAKIYFATFGRQNFCLAQWPDGLQSVGVGLEQSARAVALKSAPPWAGDFATFPPLLESTDATVDLPPLPCRYEWRGARNSVLAN